MKRSSHFDIEIKKLVEIFSDDPSMSVNFVPTDFQLADNIIVLL